MSNLVSIFDSGLFLSIGSHHTNGFDKLKSVYFIMAKLEAVISTGKKEAMLQEQCLNRTTEHTFFK